MISTPAGGAAFLASFFSELGKDTYRGVRAAILGTVRRLRNRDHERRRAVIALVIQVRNVSVCFGPLLEEEPQEADWTDEWLFERLHEAQSFVDRCGDEPVRPLGDLDCRHWLQ